jgi:NadR type nicotinamide-nucleotide adenylyltransferase
MGQARRLMHEFAVVIGKFYPPHLGHSYLIERARERAKHVSVIVCEHPEQRLCGALRAAWLREMHPDVDVHVTPDDLPAAPGPWARRTVEVLDRCPDLVCSSETYGDEYGRLMGAAHAQVDLGRHHMPVSGTIVRQDPLGAWHWLGPPVRAHFACRIVLIGVESSGKTTLARILGERYAGGFHVEEYGRTYAAALTRAWTTDDFVNIAREQQAREEAAARRHPVVICDTNATATAVWHRRYMDFDAPAVDSIARSDRVDLYLHTAPDFPFVQDGTRDGEHIRQEMEGWFEARLSASSARRIRLSGSLERRVACAQNAIERVIQTKRGILRDESGILSAEL